MTRVFSGIWKTFYLTESKISGITAVLTLTTHTAMPWKE